MKTSLYIHIPFCISKCKYCDFFSVTCKAVPIDYITALCNEIKYRLKNNNVSLLDTIYIGGGTPSLMKYNQLDKIFHTIKNNVKIEDNAEITIEVNPDDVTKELLDDYKKNGVNRISCGIQTMNDKCLQFVSRRSDYKKNINALDLFSKYWDGQLSIDVICGLPEENKSTFLDTLNTIINSKPDHISMYSLTIEDETPLGKLINDNILDYNYDFSDELWLYGKNVLSENGYNQYEVSNFSLPGKQCRHNLKYWNHQDYIGVGSGATGTVYNADGSALRWTNVKNIKEYINYWCNSQTDNPPQQIENICIEDSKFEFFMMGLRKIEGIKLSEFKSFFNCEFPDNFLTLANEWQKNNYMKIIEKNDDKIYTLGEKGILFLNKFLNNL